MTQSFLQALPVLGRGCRSPLSLMSPGCSNSTTRCRTTHTGFTFLHEFQPKAELL